MSIENRIPQVELPPDYPSEMTLRLQDQQFLDEARTMGSNIIPPFGIQQAILRSVAMETVESPGLVKALETGAGIYVATVSLVTTPQPYESDSAYAIALRGASEFNKHVSLNDEKLKDMFKRADGRMRTDAPLLTDAIEEISQRYYHDKGRQDLARYGAAAMRGFHTLVNKRLLDESSSLPQ